MTPQAPRVLYLVGGGRAQTLQARRASRFTDRVVRIGDIVVRPQRRVAVPVAFIAKHLTQIQALISTGGIVVQHDADTSVDPAELHDLVYGAAPAKPEPMPMAKPEPMAAPQPEPMPEPMPEPEPVAEAMAEPEADFTLPEGWERSPKRELLAMCAARGLEVDESSTNRELVTAIRKWAE